MPYGFAPAGKQYYGKFCSRCRADASDDPTNGEQKVFRQPWESIHWIKGGVSGDGSPSEEEDSSAGSGEDVSSSDEQTPSTTTDRTSPMSLTSSSSPATTSVPALASPTAANPIANPIATPPSPPILYPTLNPPEQTPASQPATPNLNATMLKHNHASTSSVIGAETAASMFKQAAISPFIPSDIPYPNLTPPPPPPAASSSGQSQTRLRRLPPPIAPRVPSSRTQAESAKLDEMARGEVPEDILGGRSLRGQAGDNRLY